MKDYYEEAADLMERLGIEDAHCFGTVQLEGLSLFMQHASADVEQQVRRVVAKHYVRNGQKHPDSSLGKITISPKQLREVLMDMYMVGLLSQR